ncbi:MAG TPA: hypothetical protein ENI92_08810 [Bacteroidetes bacterium]|nr:hypothetical protein [Bacteroidota bacterium]
MHGPADPGRRRSGWRAGLPLLLGLLLALLLAPAAFPADDETCEACHDDPDLQRLESGIPHSLYVNTGMIAASVHDGLDCTDCHTALEEVEDFPHEPRLPGVNCAECHEDAFQEYMAGFYDHLTQRGFTAVPGCVQCHGSHEIRVRADTRRVCGVCHNDAVRKFDGSVHNLDDEAQGLSCTSCHSAHTKGERGNMLPADWRLFTVERCLSCHKNQSADYLASHHYRQVKKGNPDAPICTDCHGNHEIYSPEDPRSQVHVDRLDATCDRCHTGHAATIHRKSEVDPRLMTCVACHTGHQTQMDRVESTIFKETVPETCLRCHGEDRHKKESLAHGRMMIVDENGQEANCTSCHIYHWKLPDEAHKAAASERIACINCHAKENRDYERSAHGVAFRKGHKEAPTCVTCHGEKKVERISSRFTGQTIISLCSSCHGNREITMRFQLNPNVVSGYLNTYHGKVYSLGFQGRKFATCISCHDNHLILPKEDPASTISRQHIIETCGRCHEDANKNFVTLLQHYDPMQKKRSPILAGIHVFMVWLLRITLGVFGLHTILWMLRSLVDRIRHGPRKRKKSRYRYKRFGVWDRSLHGLMILSFLLLAMTGLPLKYSHTEASYWIASNLLDLRTMAILHRIGAVMTFTYFFLHLVGLMARVIRGKRKLKEILWGPDSLVLQPRDAKEFVQHLGFFVGLAKKPEFGRFAYWEKFDYMAVFWGVAVIGVSGLTLWFPTFFTQLLPGWVINAAHIIHSEEALLATGFIFTIHFFNEHFRPENFPFDEVIFTGSVSERYMLEERRRWFEELEKEGRIDEIRVTPMKLLPRALLYVLGFLALAIGLALLALIVIGTFS